jgi:hypothetical protein
MYKVSWDTGSMELQTEGAARTLVQCFKEEGRQATAFGLINGDWVAISND